MRKFYASVTISSQAGLVRWSLSVREFKELGRACGTVLYTQHGYFPQADTCDVEDWVAHGITQLLANL